ncbi:hypothetical protein [Collimonas sp.]|jgi:hypothetical protein|uniref:hypothetical protein n=1 Tax=Collimonas sp. TaxID=1963772 RepID=UPI002B81D451|nr:hypothetical protein [Collimonas sp.]HWW05023.1 hypothetical protein [Collimonas sp.]
MNLSRLFKSCTFAVALCAQFMPVLGQATDVNVGSSLVGHYSLKGAREAAADIILQVDHHFKYAAMYGGTDAQADGTWSVTGNQVYLIADQSPPYFSEIQQIDQPDSDFTKDAKEPILMGLVAGTPKFGMRWQDVEVDFKFSNGKIRSAKTSSSGKVFLADRQTPEWKGVEVTEIGLAFPTIELERKWFKVDGKKTKIVVAILELGKLSQAFKTAAASVASNKPNQLIVEDDGGIVKGTYVRTATNNQEEER